MGANDASILLCLIGGALFGTVFFGLIGLGADDENPLPVIALALILLIIPGAMLIALIAKG